VAAAQRKGSWAGPFKGWPLVDKGMKARIAFVPSIKIDGYPCPIRGIPMYVNVCPFALASSFMALSQLLQVVNLALREGLKRACWRGPGLLHCHRSHCCSIRPWNGAWSTSRYFSTTSHSILSTSGSLIYFLIFRTFLHIQTYVLCCMQEEHPLPHWSPHHQWNLKKSIPPSKLLPRQ